MLDMNIIQYVQANSQSFGALPFGEVDSLVLCQLAYLHMDDYRGVSLPELYALCAPIAATAAPAHTESCMALLEALQTSQRFASVRVEEQRTTFDAATSCQYSATLFSVGGFCYLACRGTDGTLVGWKENLDLMYKEDTAAQSHALSFLNELRGTPIIVGGHSKGGNLALYAAAFCEREVQDNILAVYDHDGPGFMPTVCERDGYRTILPRVHKTVPEMCVFGHILTDDVPYTVIKADTNNIYQHLPFNWQCNADGTFVLGRGITVRSQIVRDICNTIVPAMTMDERRVFVSTVYESLRSADVQRVGDIASVKTIAKALKYNRNQSKDLRDKMSHCVHLFLSVAWGSSVDVTEEYIGATLNEWRARRQEKKVRAQAKPLHLPAEDDASTQEALPPAAADTTDDTH